MPQQKLNARKRIFVLAPLLGALIFIFLYIAATFLYPGGSDFNPLSKGFSWQHNYWCNLLNEEAINGKYNAARPIAIAGMFVLCISMAAFWWLFAGIIKFGTTGKKVIQFSGSISMCTLFFLFTIYHDAVINIAGILAIGALAGTFTGLYKTGWKNLFWFGAFNICLIGVNNVIYYTHQLFYWLPVVQKITFLCFLVWVCLTDIGLYRLNAAKHAEASA